MKEIFHHLLYDYNQISFFLNVCLVWDAGSNQSCMFSAVLSFSIPGLLVVTAKL